MDLRNTTIAVLFVLVLCCAGTAAFLFFQISNTPSPIPVPEEMLKKSAPTPKQTGEEQPVLTDIKLYFLNSDLDQLVAENRRIETRNSISERVKTALETLIAGPQTKGYVSAIPGGTQLQSVFWDDEPDFRMYVNFSEELIRNNPGHSLSEWATIYSIVNTVTAQSPAIKEVQILVNGESVKDTNTVWDWSLPFTPEKIFVQHAVKGEK